MQDLIDALLDALANARDNGGADDMWYAFAVAALKDHGYDEYGNKELGE